MVGVRNSYPWCTPMRAIGDLGSATLAGQAAAHFHSEGHVTLYVQPDRGTFHSRATISAEDMDALVRAWVERKADMSQPSQLTPTEYNTLEDEYGSMGVAAAELLLTLRRDARRGT